MAKEPHPLASRVTLTVPLWVVAILPVLLIAAVIFWWERSSNERSRLAELQTLARKLSLELEAEKSRSDAYSIEAVQLQQSLKVLEAEINRLRVKAGLPRIRLVPEPVQPNQAPPKPENTPRGAGEPIELGELLLSLRSQVEGFAAELEATARALNNPLPPDPRPGRILRRSPSAPVPASGPHTPDPAQYIPTGLPLLAETRLTSTFGYRSNPFGGGTFEFHNGADFAAPEGTPVYATATGTVSEMGWNPIFGLMILIDHGNGLHTLYGHLSSSYAEKGQQVEQGRLIGAVGSTGRSTGPHLHYTVYRYGVAVDPLPYVGNFYR
ncbi:MAG: peptidoglycan DD-metalloendopeptidase family protein [Meiothermus sp.]|uniref:M23 family metallopeptidase n=1 Tax=Meiothermus sp. TaxID=1955249 RepID=UPI0025DB93D8|nr:M23 family metallopeptidase [Meiothermus sp.]MCS7067352.1 peptidoglycan DD-metalloendopeptidase family protein [Meiothermus sp.]MDW8424699.1 peptidoglycan DD-metalloendopeptidase family protein [Meiothermus sp.]